MRILAISGSLRSGSSNTSVLEAAAALAPAGVEVRLYDGLGGLPHFNPDLDTETPPPPVTALRDLIGRSDGVMICSPEYAHGVAGSLKNALDWLVGSLEFPGKPVALVNAGARAVHSQAQLREILTTMSATLSEKASITLDLPGRGWDAPTIASDADLASQLRTALADFVADIEAHARAME